MSIRRVAAITPLIIAAFFVNPFTIAYRGQYPVWLMAPKSLVTLIVVDLLLISAMYVVTRHPAVVRRTTAWASAKIGSLKPTKLILHSLPCLFYFIYFYYSVAVANNYSTEHPAVWVIVVASALRAAAVFALLVLFQKIIGLRPIYASLTTIFVLVVIIADLVSVKNGGGRLAIETLGWVSSESFRMFFSFDLALFVISSLIILGSSAWLLYGNTSCPRGYAALLSVVLAWLVLALVTPGKIVIESIASFMSTSERFNWRLQEELTAFADDPVSRLPIALLQGRNRKVECVSKIDYENMLSTTFPITEEVALSYNKSDAPAAQIKRIILLFIESFSLSFSKKYNESLPETLTPFFDSLPNSSIMWTVSAPTTRGISTHLTSHPNADAAIRQGLPGSVVQLLQENGWKTVFFQSPFENYNDGIRNIRNLGFGEHYGADWHRKNLGDEVIREWGTFDRVTYESIVNYLKQSRDERLFLAGLTIDSHFPTGRVDYGDLDYPAEPNWTRDDPAHFFLRSVFRMDHDLKLFVEHLQREHLLNDESILIITADHSAPPFPRLTNRLGLSASSYEKIPFVVIGGPSDLNLKTDLVGSQLDTAPTVASLAGLDAKSTWWGISYLDGVRRLPVASVRGESLFLFDESNHRFVMTASPPLKELAAKLACDARGAVPSPAKH